MDDDKASFYVNRFIEVLRIYPIDLAVGIMKDMKNEYPKVYELALENDKFVEMYFESYKVVRE